MVCDVEWPDGRPSTSPPAGAARQLAAAEARLVPSVGLEHEVTFTDPAGAPLTAHGIDYATGHLDALRPLLDAVRSVLGQVKVQVSNWHILSPREDPKRSVMKRGRESDAAFCRRVLTDLGASGRIIVLNDEAHHAYRLSPELVGNQDDEEIREATVWIDGLERIDRHRGILRAVDCSATPMYPASFKDIAYTPFEWIVSDFALVDAIESGLVKIPRTPTDDNTGEAVPKYLSLWDHIKQRFPSGRKRMTMSTR